MKATSSAEAVAELISVEGMKAALNFGNSKLYEVIGSGELRTVKVGRRRFTTRRFLAEYVASLEAQAA